MTEAQRVADYFVVVGSDNLQNPVADTDTLEPITDLTVIFKSKGESPPPGYKCIDLTPTGLVADLNAGSIRSDSCFLCYKRGSDKPPLTDVGVMYEGKQRLMPSCAIIYKTPSDLVANVNNSTNMRIFITYRRAAPQFAHSKLAVTDICVVIASKGEKPPHAFNLIQKNLNQGLVGSDVYLCYRKSLARTNSMSYKAEIVSRYPLEDHTEFPLPDSVPLFCLPIGAVVECWPASARPPLPIFSTFALTDLKGGKIYAAGITFFEELPEESYSVEVQEMLSNQEQSHKGEKFIIHTNKCICLLSHYPFFDAFRKFLLAIYRLSISGSQSVPLERYISNFMTNIPFPTPDRPRVQVYMTHESFFLQEPSHGPLPISGASHSALLRCLGSDNVLILLYCALTEQKILIHSLRPALLTSVGEALTSLLFPFIWQCPYIPLCPLALADMLSAPCPFIYGIDSRFFDRGSPPDDVTCVDLDTNMITQATQDVKEPREITWRLLPKKPGKVLKDRLDDIFELLIHVDNEEVDRAVDMAPIDTDGHSARTMKEKLELDIQETFLRFHATILKGYRQFLLPITTRPTMESCDISKIFDLQGFLKSRPREYQRFFFSLTKTQLFSHFVQQRFYVSTNDSLLAFFDDCTEKCESSKPLLKQNTVAPNHRTVVCTPPDSSGLPKNEIYEYLRFPKLRAELFHQDGSTSHLKPSANPRTPPRSPAVTRTLNERNLCTMSAKKQSNSPTLWARCLLGHCFAIWFIHLPAYVKSHHNKKKVLLSAFEVLQRMAEQKAQLPDEVCFRVLMQLAGQFGHPALAVKVLFEMKRQNITANAITWGYYHRAVIDGTWTSDHKSAKELWRKLRNILKSTAAFKRGLKTPDLMSFHGSSENIGKGPNVQETASEGTCSDAGYSSLVSMEDLSRTQPVAGGLSEFSSEFPEMPSKDEEHHAVFSKGHRRVHSASEMTEPEIELGNADSDTAGGSTYPWFQRKPLVRHLSETSIGSNLSDSPGSNQIIISGSWQDPYQLPVGSYDSFDESEFRYPLRHQADIAFEAMMGTSQLCKNCARIMYDEEIMGGWSADDSNWNTVCPFCQESQVPSLQVKVKDYRGLQSKVCSTSSLNSEPASAGQSLSNAIEIARDDACETSSLLGRDNPDSLPLSPPVSSMMQSGKSSNPISIKNKRLPRDLILSSSAPTSASSSPLPGHRNSPRQQFYRVRKSSSSSSLTVFVAGAPEEKPPIYVPYLSPLVLRKELENLLINNGDIALQECDIVKNKPILFWNLVWYFKRLGLGSHLTDLVLQSYKTLEKTTEEQSRSGSRVIVSTSWDNERQSDGNHISLYMLWSLPEHQRDSFADKRLPTRSLLKVVSSHIQENDVQTPMKILLDERHRQQQIDPTIQW